MRFNESALRQIARLPEVEKEGRLSHRAPKEGYKDRWLRLRGNLLFYFRANEFGAPADSDPVGVLVIEACDVQIEPLPLGDRPFVFSIVFPSDQGRKHILSGSTLQQCQDWVTALQCCRYGYLKAQFLTLQRQLYEKTGKDAVAEDLIKRLPSLKLEGSTVLRSSGPATKTLGTLSREGAAMRRTKSAPKDAETKSTFFSDWQAFE